MRNGSKNAIAVTILLFFVTNYSLAQNYTYKRKVVQLYSAQHFYLNGGANADMLGGKSRVDIRVDLPENTIEWYYVFTTSESKDGKANIGLITQLSKLLDPTGLTGIAAEAIIAPPGEAVCDVFLLNAQNKNLFLQKADLNNGTFYYNGKGSRQNFRNGTVQVQDLRTGTHFIGIRNPSTFSGVNVTIEVAAIVLSDIENAASNGEEAISLGSLGWKAFERGDYERCLLLSQKALEMDKTLAFVQFNIALVYLMKDQNLEAITAYTKAISLTKKNILQKELFEAALADINTYMNKIPSKTDAEDIKGLLQEQLKLLSAR